MANIQVMSNGVTVDIDRYPRKFLWEGNCLVCESFVYNGNKYCKRSCYEGIHKISESIWTLEGAA